MVMNIHYSCRLQWLASMSELLKNWVSVTLPSPGNAPMIGSNIIGYIRIPHRRGSFVLSSSPISHHHDMCFRSPIAFSFSLAIFSCLQQSANGSQNKLIFTSHQLKIWLDGILHLNWKVEETIKGSQDNIICDLNLFSRGLQYYSLWYSRECFVCCTCRGTHPKQWRGDQGQTQLLLSFR
jgi:hypothetical protein